MDALPVPVKAKLGFVSIEAVDKALGLDATKKSTG